MMFLIVAHHYVVNSGITDLFDFNHISTNMIALQFLGVWGKTAINPFILITGYFMCTSDLRVSKFLKLFFERKFYQVTVFVVFLALGYYSFNILFFKDVFKLLFGWFYGVGNGFMPSFLFFYLFIPFYNRLLKTLDEKLHGILCIVLLFFFTICSTFFLNNSIMLEPVWYMTLYFVGAYIRLYEKNWMKNNKPIGCCLIISVMLSCVSIILIDFWGVRFGFKTWAYFLTDSNKFFAFSNGLLLFLFFKNLHFGQSKVINTISSSVFGVFLLHTSSYAMRQWLWIDFLNVPSMYYKPTWILVSHLLCSVAGVFFIGVVIDKLRIAVIENPFLSFCKIKIPWWNNRIFEDYINKERKA